MFSKQINTQLSYLNKGLEIVFINDLNGSKHEFKNDGGCIVNERGVTLWSFALFSRGHVIIFENESQNAEIDGSGKSKYGKIKVGR